MEIINRVPSTPVGAVIFDFDGTISTLRHGWEGVMRELMLETLGDDEDMRRRVDSYIDESTGVQTIYQMKWLAQQASEVSKMSRVPDAWEFKGEYNQRLLGRIKSRMDDVSTGRAEPGDYLICGAEEFLAGLKKRGVGMYVASGTDREDVEREARLLGVAEYFDRVMGASEKSWDCPKEGVLRLLMDECGLAGENIAVIGDGRVEIALVKAQGGRALGLASDEVRKQGVNPLKRERLIKAGADAIEGDFTNPNDIYRWLGLEDDV